MAIAEGHRVGVGNVALMQDLRVSIETIESTASRRGRRPHAGLWPWMGGSPGSSR